MGDGVPYLMTVRKGFLKSSLQALLFKGRKSKLGQGEREGPEGPKPIHLLLCSYGNGNGCSSRWLWSWTALGSRPSASSYQPSDSGWVI